MKSATLALALVLASGAVAWADATISVGVEGGVMEFDDRMSLGNAGGVLGLRGGIAFFGPTRLEARYLRSSVDVAGASATATEISGQVRLTAPIPVIKPYGFLGLGRRSTEVKNLTARASNNGWMLPFGAGIDVPLLPFLVVAPEFTWHKRLTDDTQNLLLANGDSWNLSLVVRLDL